MANHSPGLLDAGIYKCTAENRIGRALLKHVHETQSTKTLTQALIYLFNIYYFNRNQNILFRNAFAYQYI